jgi:hypothetical protein
MGILPVRVIKFVTNEGKEKEGSMTLYITKDGQRLGPYSLAEAQGLLATGTVQLNDWAWYEGLPDWIPLHQVPGLAGTAPAVAAVPAALPPARRPVLVWIISFFYFLCTPLSLLSLAMIPMLSSLPHISDAQRDYFESQGFLDYALAIVNGVGNLTAAILLFMLRRAAFHTFAGMFVFGLFVLGYNVLFKNWVGAVGTSGVVGGLIGLGFSAAILFYVWHLFRKGVLR